METANRVADRWHWPTIVKNFENGRDYARGKNKRNGRVQIFFFEIKKPPVEKRNARFRIEVDFIKTLIIELNGKML